MDYIVITLSAIALSTFIIYLLGNKVFGVRLRMKSLVMCALCAVLMSIVIPRIVVSFAGVAGTIGFLAIFAIIFAYLVAYYDDPDDLNQPLDAVATIPTLENQQHQLANTGIISTTEIEDAATTHDQALDNFNQHNLTATKTKDTLVPSEPPVETDLAEYVGEAAVGLVFGSSPIPVIAVESDNDSIYERLPDRATEPAATVSGWSGEAQDDLPAIAPMSESSWDIKSDPEPENEPALETLELAIDVSSIPDDEESTTETPQSSEPPDDAVMPPESDVSSTPDDEESATETPQSSEPPDDAVMLPETHDEGIFEVHTEMPAPNSDDLDDLLDFAFRQKESQNFALALDTFQRALKLHRDSDAAPFLAVEIASLLKNRGAYDEAITFLTVNRGLASLQQNPTMDQEYIYTIAYLRIVKNILLHHRCGFVPFPKIPQDVLQEIDAEFREWRNLA